MSLKAIKWALLAVVHDSEDKGKCTKCRAEAEIAALERAVEDLWSHGHIDSARMSGLHAAADVLDAIAKEAK